MDNPTAGSSAPGVADVSDPVAWRLPAAGQATVTLTCRGFTTTSTLTVRDKPPSQSGWRSAPKGSTAARAGIRETSRPYSRPFVVQ